MAPVSFTSGTFSTASITTSTGAKSSANNNVLYIKHSVALAGLNKLEKQSMNPDIVEFVNVIHTMFKVWTLQAPTLKSKTCNVFISRYMFNVWNFFVLILFSADYSDVARNQSFFYLLIVYHVH